MCPQVTGQYKLGGTEHCVLLHSVEQQPVMTATAGHRVQLSAAHCKRLTFLSIVDLKTENKGGLGVQK